jgi:hypothetical protein
VGLFAADLQRPITDVARAAYQKGLNRASKMLNEYWEPEGTDRLYVSPEGVPFKLVKLKP